MTLGEYLEAHDLTAAEFGRRIGASRSAVRRWVMGTRSPEPRMLRAIKLATADRVTPNDFLAQPVIEPVGKQPPEGAAA